MSSQGLDNLATHLKFLQVYDSFPLKQINVFLWWFIDNAA
jgi:hypothetical protein